MFSQELANLGGHVQVLPQFNQPLEVGGLHGVLEGVVPILVEGAADAQGLVVVVLLHGVEQQGEVVSDCGSDLFDLVDVAEVGGDGATGLMLPSARMNLIGFDSRGLGLEDVGNVVFDIGQVL
jgi:hypothetical protein